MEIVSSDNNLGPNASDNTVQKKSEPLRIILAIVASITGVVLILYAVGLLALLINRAFEVLYQTGNTTVPYTFGRPNYSYVGYSVGLVFSLIGAYTAYIGIKAVADFKLLKKAIILCIITVVSIAMITNAFFFNSISVTPTLVNNNSDYNKYIQISPTPYTDPSYNWKTYANNNSGFIFKYPNDWDVSKTASGATFGPKGSNGIAVYLTISTNKNDFTDFRSTKLCSQVIEPTGTTQPEHCIDDSVGQAITQIQLGEKYATSFNLAGGPDFSYRIVQYNQDPSVELKMYTAGGGTHEVFDQILSTFRFVPEIISPTPSPYPSTKVICSTNSDCPTNLCVNSACVAAPN